MDLGRPIARHDIRRPHEMRELEEILLDSAADEQSAGEQPVESETSER